MNDCISRKEVIETIEWYDKNVYYIECLNDIIEYIKKMPSVTPHPKTGHWIVRELYGRGRDPFKMEKVIFCSNCETAHRIIEGDLKWFEFCPKCGADMRGKEFIEGLNKDGDREEESMVD